MARSAAVCLALIAMLALATAANAGAISYGSSNVDKRITTNPRMILIWPASVRAALHHCIDASCITMCTLHASGPPSPASRTADTTACASRPRLGADRVLYALLRAATGRQLLQGNVGRDARSTIAQQEASVRWQLSRSV